MSSRQQDAISELQHYCPWLAHQECSHLSSALSQNQSARESVNKKITQWKKARVEKRVWLLWGILVILHTFFFSLHFSNKLIWSKTYVEDVQRATFSEHQQLRTRQAKACEAPTCSTEAAAPSSKGLQKKLKAFCQSCSPSQAWQNSLHPPRASKCTALHVLLRELGREEWADTAHGLQWSPVSSGLLSSDSPRVWTVTVEESPDQKISFILQLCICFLQ